MTERVEPLDLGVSWDPNGPEAVLVSEDDSRSALGLRAHFDDPDQRAVVVIFGGVYSARMGSPNDEGLSGHPLYDKGLKGVLWSAVVIDSETIAAMRRQWSSRVFKGGVLTDRVMPNHYLVLTKECMVEVLADSIEVHRVDGSPLAAVASALSAR